MKLRKVLSAFALVVLLGSLGAGCAFVKAQKASFDLCMADKEPGGCKEHAEVWQARSQLAGETITTGVATIVPGAAIAIKPVGTIVGYVGLVLAGILGGYAMTKKKEEENPQ